VVARRTKRFDPLHPGPQSSASFFNARSIRNALDRARLRQANRLVYGAGARSITAEDLTTIDAADLLVSRVFGAQAGADTLVAGSAHRQRRSKGLRP